MNGKWAKTVLNQNGDKTISICICFKSKCLIVHTPAFFSVQSTRQWPEHDLASVLAYAPIERKCQEHAALGFLSYLESVLWHFLPRSKPNSNCGYFFCGNNKRENMCMVNQTVHLCVGWPMYHVPLVRKVTYSMYSSWLCCMSPLSLLKHTDCPHHTTIPANSMTNGCGVERWRESWGKFKYWQKISLSHFYASWIIVTLLPAYSRPFTQVRGRQSYRWQKIPVSW